MKRTLTFALALAASAVFVLTSPSSALAEYGTTELLQRVEALEAELAQQRADFVSYDMGGTQQHNGKGKGCDDCRSRTVYAAYELAVLRPYVSDALSGPGFDNDYGIGHRFIVGAQNDSGVGARVRYLMFNTGHGTVPPLGPGSLGIDLDVADLEVTLAEQMSNWDLMVSGGVRYGRLGFQFDDPAELSFEGTGPTVALEAVRDIGCRGLHLVGNFRASLLMGEIHDQTDVTVGADDEIMTVLESQLGVGWTREMGRAALDLHAVWETQFWLNDTFADDFLGFGSNFALSGAVISAQVRM